MTDRPPVSGEPIRAFDCDHPGPADKPCAVCGIGPEEWPDDDRAEPTCKSCGGTREVYTDTGWGTCPDCRTSLDVERLARALASEWPFAYSPPEAWQPIVERALARLTRERNGL